MSVLSCSWFCRALRCEWTVNQPTAAPRPSDGRIHGDMPKMATQINSFVWISVRVPFHLSETAAGESEGNVKHWAKAKRCELSAGSSPVNSGASSPFYLLAMTKNSWGFDSTTIVFFNKSYINLMPTWRLLFTFPHQYDLISLENKYNGLHSGTRLKNNLLYCCFIARNIYVT